MKRLLSLLFLLLSVMFICTGCVRIRATINISENGKIDYTLLYAQSSSMSELSDSDLISEDEIAEYITNGFTVEPYSQDGYTGYIISKSGMSDFTAGLFDSDVTVTKNGSNYIVEIPWDDTDEDGAAYSLSEYGDLIASQSGFAEIVITLPSEAVSSNATSVSADNKTLTWNLLEMGERNTISFEYNPPFSLRQLIISFIIIFDIALVCVVVYFIVKHKKKKSAAASSVAAPTAPFQQETASEENSNDNADNTGN